MKEIIIIMGLVVLLSLILNMEILIELFNFLLHRKKLWLAPIIIVLLVIGGLLILAQGSVVAPFIYTIF